MKNLQLSTTLLFIFLVIQLSLRAQNKVIVGTVPIYDSMSLKISRPHARAEWNFNARSYIIPAVMVAYGFIAIENNALKHLDKHVQHELYAERPHPSFKIDDHLRFAPGVIAYGLDFAGVKSKHSFKDKTIMVLMSNIISNVAVSTIKKHSHQLRPGSTSSGSFPSAHTAYAFTNAEFLSQEYRDVSPWYTVLGYTMAAGTGYLRIYNNKHWLSDVVTGAGVGIFSTKLVYWLYPAIQHSLSKTKFTGTVIMPIYHDGAIGFALVHKL